jgi:hypothetical protein
LESRLAIQPDYICQNLSKTIAADGEDWEVDSALFIYIYSILFKYTILII